MSLLQAAGSGKGSNTVVDLGLAPGGWSQATSPVLGDKGRLIVSDIWPMNSIFNVTFIQG